MSLTYTIIQSQIKDILENDGTEFSDAVPSFTAPSCFSCGQFKRIRVRHLNVVMLCCSRMVNKDGPNVASCVEHCVVPSVEM